MRTDDVSGCSLPSIDGNNSTQATEYLRFPTCPSDSVNTLKSLNRSNISINIIEDNMKNEHIVEQYSNYTEFQKILHDIRNMIILTDEKIKCIETFSELEKMEIIISLNSVLENMVDVINAVDYSDNP